MGWARSWLKEVPVVPAEKRNVKLCKDIISGVTNW